jgi:hypothetical protein
VKTFWKILIIVYLSASASPATAYLMKSFVIFRTLWLCLVLLVLQYTSYSQPSLVNPYTYQELSHVSQLRLRDSLRKNWKAPVIFTQKETQKRWAEMWEERTSFITDGITAKNFIQEKEVYEYLWSIIHDLKQGSPKLIPHNPALLIDRSSAVNAYSIGSRIICVNLGLLSFVKSREELSLILAHELAHDALNHSENAMKERAEWLTSAEYKKSLESVLDSKYERLTRLKKVLESYKFSRTRHNRYHESEADSLAVVMLANSRIPFDARHFLRLDSSDLQYQIPLAKPLGEYFTAYQLPFEQIWVQKTSRGLSSRNYSFKTLELADSLRTHPDCRQRYEQTKKFAHNSITHTPLPKSLVEKVNKMILWNLFDNQNFTACLYRLLQAADGQQFDSWHLFMMHNVFTGLAFADQELRRFNVINVVQKEYIAQSYYELQTMLAQMPATSLQLYSRRLADGEFWQHLPSDARNLRSFLQTLSSQEANSKARANAAKSFSTSFTSSMYCELTDHFIN